MSIEPDSSYDYKVGGVVPLNNLTYVKRKADEDLYKWLKAGEFCYVLNSRQMGKTSLLIRTLRRLERAGFVCANIDISGEIGTDLENPKQWYSTLLEIIADSFNLDFPGWWNECKSLPPIRQLSKFIENVLLDSVEENVVIFIDEIDSVLGLEFNVDDFFAFIRACYNKREFNQKYKRLTFTLFGVATPADLIKDKQRTPFNIGKAVELHGFQFNEAQRLAQGFAGKLNNPQRILQLVLDWTGGQPFLTQKLCDLLLKSPSSVPIDDEVSWLEQIVRTQVIEDWEYHDEPQHLKTIRDRLLRNEQHTSRLLGLYQQILQNGKVKVDNSLEQMELLLSGLVVKQQGMLKVYNRIYETVFNLCWVDQVLADLRPYAEQIESWLKSNCQEESKLLRGTALQAAMDWKIGKKLSDDDYNFLTASRDKEAEREQTKMAQELVGNVSNALALYREVQLWTGEQSFLSDYFYKLIGNYSFPISEGSEVEFVEDLVQNFIKNWESKKETKYLRTIQEHILSNNDQASNLLKIYKQILQQGELIFDQSKEQQELIKIGLVIKHQEKLKVANRICEFVFNLSWVNEILSSMVLVADPELPEGQVDLASVSPINQSSTANQDQNVGSVTDNSIVFRDVYGNVYFGTYKRPATGAPFQVPYLPQYFVERPEHHKQIKTRLLSNQGNRTGTLVVSAIYGLGGIGKSTLAAAVAHDPQVQAQFSDGVLWVTLGQQPDLLSLLSAWIQALGDYDYKPLTLDGASRHLRTLLHDKKALLVVDDVWNPEHVEPFRVGGSSCQLLVTTREATIKGAISYDLNVMTPDESLELLQKSQNNPLTKAEQQQAQQLAQTVGYLPLALDLAAAQVADGVSWQELLEDLRSEIARLESLQTPGADSCIHEEQRKHYSLIASFRLSLRWLTPEMLRQFAWFGVLPEDVVITHTMAAMLWEINPRQALTTLRSFKAKALLLAGATGDNQKQTYRLHDLMHDVAKRLLTSDSSPHKPEELPGLGLSLTAAHSILLDQYRSKTEQGLWHTLPDDGYIHANLSWHLEQASRTEELHQLLMEETAQGRNGWYETCERLGQTGNFVTDVARAWRLAEEMFEENPSKSIALQCRYALITTSLNSLAKNIPGHLMAALVKQKLWSPAQGLAYAQQVKESEQRAEALGALAPHLSKSLLAIALDAARVIQDDYYRATALGGLAPYLPEILQQALDSVRSIEDDYYRATALSGLAPHLPPELLQQALDSARSIEDDYYRATALGGLAPHLPPELLQQALDSARSIEDDYYRATALGGLAPHLPPELLQQALDSARSIEDDYYRATALGGLAPYLPEILQQALDSARSIEDDYYRATALSGLAPYLPSELLQQALDSTRSIEDDYYRATALSGLAPYLPTELLQQALDAARSIEDDYYRATALGGLAPYLPEILQEALDSVRSIEDDYYRATALGGLAPYLPSELLQQTLDSARGIQNNSYRVKALNGLAPHLPEILQEALDAARLIQDDSYRVKALSGLAPHLPEILQEALDAARCIQDDYYRATALSGLAPHLPEILQEALNAARCIQDDYYRATALSGLAPHLPEILQEALNAARCIQDDFKRATALSGLAPHLPEILQEALDAARCIQDDFKRATALSGLVPHLPGILQEALNAARCIQDDFKRTTALSGLVPHLPGILQEALDAARCIQDELDRAKALSELAPHLPEVVQEALDAARRIQDDFKRAKALSELAPHLSEVVQEALDAARCIQDDFKRGNCFSSLLLALNLASIKFHLWREILHNLSHRYRYDLLINISKLSDTIIALGGAEALLATVRAIQQVCRQWR